MSLGRGLGALITPTSLSKPQPSTPVHAQPEAKIWDIPVTEIRPTVNQPRKQFVPEELQELSESIKQHGILQPILVSEQVDGKYEIIAGERRYRAAKLAGLSTVPVIVKPLPSQQLKLEMALIENIQRADLNPLEEAFAYKRLMEEFNLTQQDVADKVGKSRPVVANMVRLLDLPNPVQTALIEGKIKMSQARTLLSLENEEQQIEMLQSMMGQKITVRELEKQVHVIQVDKSHQRRDPNMVYLENQLRTKLGAKVSISQKGEKGSITINYYSKEELSDIVKKMIE
jgi:ParB family chromosome partitioning protein